MVTTLYYFSGTGNSLYIAQELQKLIPESIILPIAALLNNFSTVEKNKCNSKIKITSNTIGFIFPCHGLTIPIPVKSFLQKLDLKATEYIFAIVTRGGSVFRGFSVINKILKKQHKKLHASFIINMWMNDPKLKFFSVPNQEQLKEIEKKILKKIPLILRIINNREIFEDDINGDTFSRFNIINYVLERLVSFAVHHIAPKTRNYFYVDSKCTGCRTCEKICPSKKISMEDNKPIWQRDVDCFYCYGCLNYCPAQAIQIYSKFYMKSYTSEKGRYPHPYAQVKDMINQKTLISTT